VTLADMRVGLRAYLLDDAAIAAIVGSRVHPLVLPQGDTGPSIVYSRISAVGDHHMSAASGLVQTRLQLDCWAASLDNAAALADLVKQRLDGFSGTMLWGEDSPAEAIVVQGIFFDGEREDFDNAAKLHRVSRDYLIWYEER